MKIWVILPLLLWGSWASAQINALNSQQNPVSSHNEQNAFAFNPAFAGAEDQPLVTLSGQNLSAILDSLRFSSDVLHIQAPLEQINGGIGARLLYVWSPISGRYTWLDVGFSYVIFEHGRDGELRVGASAGLGLHEVVFSGFFPGGIPEQRFKAFPNLGAGLRYENSGLLLAVGADHLGRPQIDFSTEFRQIIDDIYYFQAQYAFEVADLKIKPSYFGRYANNANFLNDFLVIGGVEQRFEAGLGYRLDLRRRFPPNQSNPIILERFKQLIIVGSVGFAENFILNAAYNLTLTEFGGDPNNYELTLTYILPE
jgi:type IX secretion system PorP/SprF family membrane protein